MKTLLGPTHPDETIAAPRGIDHCCKADRRRGESKPHLNELLHQVDKRVQRKQQDSTGVQINQALSEQVQRAFIESGYRLKNVRCVADDWTLCLSGFVNRYFDLQMAIQIARRFQNGHRIELQIKVLSKSFNL